MGTHISLMWEKLVHMFVINFVVALMEKWISGGIKMKTDLLLYVAGGELITPQKPLKPWWQAAVKPQVGNSGTIPEPMEPMAVTLWSYQYPCYTPITPHQELQQNWFPPYQNPTNWALLLSDPPGPHTHHPSCQFHILLKHQHLPPFACTTLPTPNEPTPIEPFCSLTWNPPLLNPPVNIWPPNKTPMSQPHCIDPHHHSAAAIWLLPTQPIAPNPGHNSRSSPSYALPQSIATPHCTLHCCHNPPPSPANQIHMPAIQHQMPA